MPRKFVDPLLKIYIMNWIKENEKLFIGKGSAVLGSIVNDHFQSDVKNAMLTNWATSIGISIRKPNKPKKPKKATPPAPSDEIEEIEETLEFYKKWHFKHHHKIIKLEKRMKSLRNYRKRAKAQIKDLQDWQDKRIGKSENFGKKLDILIMATDNLYHILGIDKPESFKELKENPGYLGMN